MTVFIHVILIALIMIALALVFLLPYAMLEKPHRQREAQVEDVGWTREDAETSGL